VNVEALVEELVEDSELHNKDKVLTPPPAQPPQPNFKEQADLLKAQADMKDVQVKQEMAENDKQHNIAKLMMEMEKIKRQNAELQLKIKEVEIKDLAARGSVIKDLADVTMAEKDHHLNLAVAQSDALLRKAEIDVSRIPNNGQTQ
jgi:hypothetical protein